MSTSLEDRLRRSLHEGATSVDVPAPPDLRHSAERRQRRRRGAVAVLGSAALVAAIIAVPQLWERRPADAPPVSPSRTAGLALSLEDLPKGAAPQRLYIHDGALALPRAVRIPARDLILGGDTVLVEGRPREWHLRSAAMPYERGLDLPELVDRPALSSDGRLLAWAEPASRRTHRIVLFDVEAGRSLGSTEVGIGLREEFRLIGVDDSGRVFWSGSGRSGSTTWVWSRATGTREVVLPTGSSRISDVLSYPVVLDREGMVGQVDVRNDGARFRASFQDDALSGALVSPDGRHFVTPGGTVHWLAGDDPVRFRLDGSLHPRVLAFESDEAVLVEVSKYDREAIARCFVETGACEHALDVEPGTSLVFPG